MGYPKSNGSKRPFRLWDAKGKHALRWRCYKYRENAHNGAVVEMRWSAVGDVIEVYNAVNGRLVGQYRRGTDVIHFTGAK